MLDINAFRKENAWLESFSNDEEARPALFSDLVGFQII